MSEQVLTMNKKLAFLFSGQGSQKVGYMEKFLARLELNKFVSSKPETLVTYHLCLMHFLILKRKVRVFYFIQLIQNMCIHRFL